MCDGVEEFKTTSIYPGWTWSRCGPDGGLGVDILSSWRSEGGLNRYILSYKRQRTGLFGRMRDIICLNPSLLPLHSSNPPNRGNDASTSAYACIAMPPKRHSESTNPTYSAYPTPHPRLPPRASTKHFTLQPPPPATSKRNNKPPQKGRQHHITSFALPPHTPFLRAHAEKNTGKRGPNGSSYEMNNSNHILKKKQERARLHHNYTTTVHPPTCTCLHHPTPCTQPHLERR